MRHLLVTLLAAFVAAAASDHSAAMTFRAASYGGSDGNWWIAAEGPIESDTPAEFQAFLDAKGMTPATGQEGLDPKYGVEVWLDSPGGDVYAAIKFGKLIRAYGLGTNVSATVDVSASDSAADPAESSSEDGDGALHMQTDAPGTCESACLYPFSAGVWRHAKDQTVGVHEFRYDDLAPDVDVSQMIAQSQAAEGYMVDYLVSMGVDARVLVPAGNTVPSDMHMLTTAEMLAYNVIWDSHAYGPWTLEAYKQGLIAYSRSQDGADTVTLFCRQSDHKLRLLTATPGYADQALVNELAQQGVRFMGVEIDPPNILPRNSDKVLRIEIVLPDGIKADPTNPGLAAISMVDYPFFDHPTPIDNFDDDAALVRRNCS